jgi:hypothetical protein
MFKWLAEKVKIPEVDGRKFSLFVTSSGIRF